MDSSIRRPTSPLIQQLIDEPWQFDFFQAVRIIQLSACQAGEESPVRTFRPIGGQWSPDDEIVRFHAEISFGFPAAEISNAELIQRDGDAGVEFLELETTFMAMAGTSGVLPQHYTQRILDRERRNDFAFRRFLDIFHHRIISLFYRAWEKYRFPFAWERSQLDQRQGIEDQFTQTVYSLVGFGTDSLNPTQTTSSVLRNRLDLEDETFLYYAGLFLHTPRNVTSLKQMLVELFNVPVDIVQFRGQWVPLDPRDQTQLNADSANCGLGQTAFVGSRVRDVQGRIRIRLGPLSLSDFRRFSPGSIGFRKLSQLVRMWVGVELDVDIQPLLRPDEVPKAVCGNSADASRLGWNTWIRNAPPSRPLGEAVFEIEDRYLTTN